MVYQQTKLQQPRVGDYLLITSSTLPDQFDSVGDSKRQKN